MTPTIEQPSIIEKLRTLTLRDIGVGVAAATILIGAAFAGAAEGMGEAQRTHDAEIAQLHKNQNQTTELPIPEIHDLSQN